MKNVHPICKHIDITDEKGKRHRPQEWFIAPIEVIEEDINLIISQNITAFRFDYKAIR